jgi:hypothetical protein
MKAFPSLKSIHNITGISLSQIRRSIDHMEQLGVISVEHRIDEDKGQKSNLYTLYDYAKLWNAGSSEEIETIKQNNFVNLKEVSTEVLEKELERRKKEKELVSEAAKPHQQAPKSTKFTETNNTTNSPKSQVSERYTIEKIRTLFDYDIIVADRPLYQRKIDAVMNILHTTLNTTKPTIRIGGEDKPSEIVIGKLMKLTFNEIIYCADKYSEQTERINNPTAYMLTLLYNAKEQMELDLANQVKHDMANWNSQG